MPSEDVLFSVGSRDPVAVLASAGRTWAIWSSAGFRRHRRDLHGMAVMIWLPRSVSVPLPASCRPEAFRDHEGRPRGWPAGRWIARYVVWLTLPRRGRVACMGDRSTRTSSALSLMPACPVIASARGCRPGMQAAS